MALAAPDYFAGAKDPIKGAYALFTTAGWVRRRCNEVLAEASLDPVKLYDLAGQCFIFRQEADKWIAAGEVTAVLEELVRLTLSAGMANTSKTPVEINDDYKQLYSAAGSFITWATANLPQTGEQVLNATVTVNRTWPNTDFNVRVPKLAAVSAQVQALRDVFL